MSILFCTYKPISPKAFVSGGGFDNLNSAVSFVRCSGIYPHNKYVLRKDICFKFYPSSPCRTEAIHCSSDQSKARYWHHFGFPL